MEKMRFQRSLPSTLGSLFDVRPAMKIGAVVCIIIVAACAPRPWLAPPGKYQSYREAISSTLEAGMTDRNWADVPQDVRHRLAECTADLVVANVTPAQLGQLDAAARGESAAPAELGHQVNQQLESAVGIVHRGDFAALEPYCPGDIPTFRRYVRQ